MKRSFRLSMVAFCALGATQAIAEDWRGGYTLYGTSGLVEMPSAFARPDAEIGVTLGGFENQQRGVIQFPGDTALEWHVSLFAVRRVFWVRNG